MSDQAKVLLGVLGCFVLTIAIVFIGFCLEARNGGDCQQAKACPKVGTPEPTPAKPKPTPGHKADKLTPEKPLAPNVERGVWLDKNTRYVGVRFDIVVEEMIARDWHAWLAEPLVGHWRIQSVSCYRDKQRTKEVEMIGTHGECYDNDQRGVIDHFDAGIAYVTVELEELHPDATEPAIGQVRFAFAKRCCRLCDEPCQCDEPCNGRCCKPEPSPPEAASPGPPSFGQLAHSCDSQSASKPAKVPASVAQPRARKRLFRRACR